MSGQGGVQYMIGTGEREAQAGCKGAHASARWAGRGPSVYNTAMQAEEPAGAMLTCQHCILKCRLGRRRRRRLAPRAAPRAVPPAPWAAL